MLNRHTARGLGARLHSHIKTHFRLLPDTGGLSLPRPPHTQKEENEVLTLVPLSPSLIPFSEQKARPSSVDQDPGTVAALQMEQRQLPSFNWKFSVSYLFHSEPGESNEKEILFLPPS